MQETHDEETRAICMRALQTMDATPVASGLQE
jgi:hypothetical protein